MAETGDVTVKVEKLTAKNYSTWKTVMTSLLKSKGLWNVIFNSVSGSDEGIMKQNELAKHLMYASMNADQITATGTCVTAHELWNKIKENFEGDEQDLQQNALADFLGFKYRKGESAISYCGRYELAFGRVASAGHTIDKTTKLWVFKNSLPKDMKQMVSIWLTARPLGTLPQLISYLKTQCMDDHVKQEDSVALYSGENSRNSNGKSRNFGRTGNNSGYKTNRQSTSSNTPGGSACSYCKKEGHFWKACNKLKDDNKRKKTFANQRKANEDRRNNNNAFMAVEPYKVSKSHLLTSINKHAWIVDSGASHHMSPNKEILTNYSEYDEPITIRLGNGRSIEAYGEGRLDFHNGKFEGHLEHVRWVPDLKENLFSVGSALKAGHDVRFINNSSEVHFMKSNNITLKGYRSGQNLFLLNLVPRQRKQPLILDDMAAVSVEEWHKRFAHNAYGSLNELVNNRAVTGLKIDRSDKPSNKTCEDCLMGKLCRASHKTVPRIQATENTAVLHIDTCGPISDTGIHGQKYFVLSTEEYSDYKLVEFIASKEEIPNAVKRVINRVEVETKRPVKMIQTDNGSEFCNNKLAPWLDDKGIIHNTSTRYTPEQNGRAERANRTIIEAARALLNGASVTKDLWPEAVNTAVYSLNRVLSPRDKSKTRYELYFGEKPDVSNLRIFGQRAIVKVPDSERKGKFASKGEECIFVGYTQRFNTYRFYDPSTGSVFTSCDVAFPIHSKRTLQQSNVATATDSEQRQEIAISFSDPTVPVQEWSDPAGEESHGERETSLSVSRSDTSADAPEPAAGPDDSFKSTSTSGNKEPTTDGYDTSTSNDSDISTDSEPTIIAEPQPQEDTLVRRITRATRGATDFIKDPSLPKYFWSNGEEDDKDGTDRALFTLDDEPRTLKDAQERSDWDKWKAAMDEEIHALKKNGTWELVDKPQRARPVKCKWVFKVKLNPQGDIERYKARLVAKGYSQIPNVDYKETFAPVASMITIRTLFAIANQHDMEILQFDVKTAFLYGDLNETIYMEYPEGYPNPGNKVCRLIKSLYGLKQAPRQWNLKFDQFLQRFKLKQSIVDKCLYFNQDFTLLLAIYVDDGLVTSRDKKLLDDLIKYLKSNFELKVMDCEAYLGFQIIRNREKRELKLLQAHYIEKVLEKFGMTDCKPASTPEEVTTSKPIEADMELLDESYPFKELVGSLLYLVTCTRPDIAHAVSVASRTAKPTQHHWKMLKRILRYLKATPTLGIHFRWEKVPHIVGYSDADYANDIETRRSTTGYCIFYGRGPIAWRCQRQAIVTLSTTEAEYVSGCELVKELLPLRELMIETRQIADEPTTVFIDNLSTVRIAQNEGGQQRTKHIDVREKWLNEQVEQRKIVVKHISGDKQAADILTKPLHKTKFVTNRNLLVSAMAMLALVTLVQASSLTTLLRTKRKLVRANPLQFRSTDIPYFDGDIEIKLRHALMNICGPILDDQIIREKITEEQHLALINECDLLYKELMFRQKSTCSPAGSKPWHPPISVIDPTYVEKMKALVDAAAIAADTNVTASTNDATTTNSVNSTILNDITKNINATAPARKKRAVPLLIILGLGASAGLSTFGAMKAIEASDNAQEIAFYLEKEREALEYTARYMDQVKNEIKELKSWSAKVDKNIQIVKDNAEVAPRVAAIFTEIHRIYSGYKQEIADMHSKFEMKKVPESLRKLGGHKLWDEPAAEWSTFHDCFYTGNTHINSIVRHYHFSVPRVNKKIKIMEASPVSFYNRTETDKKENICWMTYNGPAHVLVNETNNCMSEIIEWATDHKSVRSQTCEGPEDQIKDDGRLWKQESCTDSITPQKKRIRDKEVNGLHRIYCYPFDIKIENEEPIPCPDYVFELEGRVTYKIAGYEHIGAYVDEAIMPTSEVHLNREIMQHLKAQNIPIRITNNTELESTYNMYVKKLKELPNKINLKKLSFGTLLDYLPKFVREFYDWAVSSLEWIGIVLLVFLVGFVLVLISPLIELLFMSFGIFKLFGRNLKKILFKLRLGKPKRKYWEEEQAKLL